MMGMRQVLLLVCGLFTLLTGCSGKTVMVVDEAGFHNLAKHFGRMLKGRQILDADGAWREPLVSFGAAPENVGDRLFRSLSPVFRFREVDAVFVPATFAASWAEGDELTVLPCGFTLVQGVQQVSVSLLGLADWDGDGKADWFVQCTVSDMQSPTGEDKRDYYLVITEPEAALIRPQVLGVYDCRNRRCVAYADIRDCPPENCVVELLAGQRVVTAPPVKSGKRREPDAFREQKLKN